MIVAFSGHRPQKLGGFTKQPNPTQIQICEKIREVLIKLNPDKVISGMAQGVDQWAAEIAVDLEIPFIAAIPHVGQEFAWPLPAADYYRELLKDAEEVVIVSKGPYASWKMQKRNEWMVDHCDTLVAVWDGTSGGTANCIKYAEKVKKKIIYIHVNASKCAEVRPDHQKISCQFGSKKLRM